MARASRVQSNPQVSGKGKGGNLPKAPSANSILTQAPVINIAVKSLQETVAIQSWRRLVTKMQHNECHTLHLLMRKAILITWRGKVKRLEKELDK